MNLLFLYLTAFSTNGGIEKFNKAFMKAVSEMEGVNFKAYSPHDKGSDSRYISLNKFKGFSGNKVLFSMESVAAAGKHDTIVLGHINLAPIGLLIKRLYPHKRLILITHGIEIWTKLSGLKKKLLDETDEIIAVSNFTKAKLTTEQGVEPDKISILYNTIDPYFDLQINKDMIISLKKKYQLADVEKIILTVCRISSAEKYKGYDKVIEALPKIIKRFPQSKYLLVGRYDEQEKSRIFKKIQKLNLINNFILAGYVPEIELSAHYYLADVFAMPSSGEGFGIVFLEAMACGLPVITGNNDGSKEILEKINNGIAVDPDNIEELSLTIISMLSEKVNRENNSKEIDEVFGFENFKTAVRNMLEVEQEEIIET